MLPFVVINSNQDILAPTWRLFTAIGQSQLDANLWYAQKLGEEIVDPKNDRVLVVRGGVLQKCVQSGLRWLSAERTTARRWCRLCCCATLSQLAFMYASHTAAALDVAAAALSSPSLCPSPPS